MSNSTPLFTVSNQVLVNFFKAGGASNYVSNLIEDLDTGEDYIITMQRVNGTTPLHELENAKAKIQLLEKSLAAHESKTKETKLPANTPVNVVEWVRKVEQFYSVNALKGITELSTMNDIEQAYNIDRSALIGIGEELLEAAKWDAWPDSSFE